MPNNDDGTPKDDLDLDVDGATGTDGDDGADDGADDLDDDASAAADTKKKSPEDTIKGLQSVKDKETARANKAEAALKAALARGKAPSEGSSNPELDAVRGDLREAALDAAFAEFGELKEYNIARELVDGSTRAEVRENATALVALVKSVATKARNKALTDAGVKVDPSGAARTKPVDYAAMSKEAFDKLVDGVA